MLIPSVLGTMLLRFSSVSGFQRPVRQVASTGDNPIQIQQDHDDITTPPIPPSKNSSAPKSNLPRPRPKTQKKTTHFCPAYNGSVLVALHTIPSYTTSLLSATVLHQNGCSSILKSLTVPLVTLNTVKAIGRPSPSERERLP